MIIVDTHTHAGPNWFEPVEMLVHQMHLNGVDKAVLIQHGRPEHGHYDHTYLFECLERFPGRFSVVVIVDLSALDSLGTLERHRENGAIGVRLTPSIRSSGDDPLAIWRKVDELGMLVSCMGSVNEFASDEFADIVKEFPNLPIIIEHLAGGGQSASFPGNGEGPKPPYTLFKKAMELSLFSNTFLKIHGLGEILNRPSALQKDFNHDFFGPMPPLVEMAKEAFGVRRMMWGSDYPPVSGREGYRNALVGARDHPAFETLEEIEWVLGKTALEVIEFA